MSISIVIPTHERPTEVTQLIKDLLIYTEQSAKIIVIDTSKQINAVLKSIQDSDFKYIYLPDNLGISYSRNLGLNQVDDDFVLFMDDDFVLSYKSRLTEFKKELQKQDYHILGGEVNNVNAENYDFHGKYTMKNNVLYHYVGLSNASGGYDVIFNYFICKTEKILSIGGWDNRLKFAREHDDFFMNGKLRGLKVGYSKDFGINHVHNGRKYYEDYEINTQGESIKYFLEKWGISSKVEIRIIGTGKDKYLSIYRFMGEAFMSITREELMEIYKEYELDYLSIPFIYKHVGYE